MALTWKLTSSKWGGAVADASETMHLVDAALVRLIPQGATLQGVVTSQLPQQLLIEGRFAGRMELDAASRIVIAAGAHIDAEILRAETIVVRGEFKGAIHAHVVEIASTARVSGTVRYDEDLSIEPGARIRASIEGPAF